MFKPVSSKVNFPEMEKGVLQFWKDRDIFHRTETEREGKPLFMLYEGPPTANGNPGIHHVLARVFKDIIPRYKTMKGYRCLRKGGWDTHGLPVELEVEKELGLMSKRDIEEYGIEKFNRKCRESVFSLREGMGKPDRPGRLLGGHGAPLRHPWRTTILRRVGGYSASSGIRACCTRTERAHPTAPDASPASAPMRWP